MKRITLIVTCVISVSLFGCTPRIDQTIPGDFIPRFSEEFIPKGYYFEGNTVIYKMTNSLLKIKYMEQSDIDLFFLKHKLANPFLGANILKENLTLFLFTIQNNENTVIRFDPRRPSIYLGGSYYRGTLDFTEVMVACEKLSPGMDYEVFKKTMYDLELDILPKSTVEGLLIFPFIPKGSKKIVVMISGIYIGDQTVDVPFEFNEK